MSDVFGLRGSTGVAAGGAGFGGNPLVAAPVDTTTPFSGLRLIDDGFQIQQAIKNGDWLSGSMAGVAAIADGLQFAFNPIAGVVSWVVGWILDHVEPLKGWLNDLTGDAGEVSAASATWTNISTYLMSASEELLGSLDRTLAEQTSLAVDAYKRLMRDAAAHVEMASGLAEAISSGLMVAATIVQIVHDLVRDAISDIIGQFASAVIQAALSLGTLVPKIVADIAWKVSSWVTRIGTKIDDVIRSSDRLSALFKKADDLLARLKNVFNRIIHGTDDAPTHGGHGAGDGLPANHDLPLSMQRALTPEEIAKIRSGEYSCVWFDDVSKAEYYDGLSPTLGRDGRAFFVMPAEDAALIKTPQDAARYTGNSPATMRAIYGEVGPDDMYLGRATPGEVYTIVFPKNGIDHRLPTLADANGWSHFVEGGHTAVRTGVGPGAGFLMNPTREAVIPGGTPIPPGSMLLKLGPDGSLILVREF